MDELKRVLASIQVGDDLDGEGLCWLFFSRLYATGLDGAARRAATRTFEQFVLDWFERFPEAVVGVYAGGRGDWNPHRVQLLADAKKHFGVAV